MKGPLRTNTCTAAFYPSFALVLPSSPHCSDEPCIHSATDGVNDEKLGREGGRR